MQTDKLLRDLARDDPQIPGQAGDVLRARLAQQAASDLIQDIHLAHARSREAVVTGARMALRCGALLLQAGGEWAPTLRAAGISEHTGAEYVALALAHPELAAIALRRFGRISEAQALQTLGGGAAAAPAGDLRRLRGLLP